MNPRSRRLRRQRRKDLREPLRNADVVKAYREAAYASVALRLLMSQLPGELRQREMEAYDILNRPTGSAAQKRPIPLAPASPQRKPIPLAPSGGSLLKDMLSGKPVPR